jgi:hypothetical protein
LERVSNKHDDAFPAATLYLDDIVEVTDTFCRVCGRIEITAGEYKITDATELNALAEKFPSGRFENFKIQGFEPYVSLDLTSFGARTYISENSLEQRLVVTSAKEVLQRCKKTSPDLLPSLAGFSLFGVGIWAFSAKSSYLGGLIVLVSFLLLTFSLRLRMKNTVIVYTKYRSQAKTFLQRKQDDVLIAIIAAALGAAATYAVTKLLP